MASEADTAQVPFDDHPIISSNSEGVINLTFCMQNGSKNQTVPLTEEAFRNLKNAVNAWPS